MRTSLSLVIIAVNREENYQAVLARVDALLSEPCDWTAAMATVVSELHEAFDHFQWTGFYRTIRKGHLQIGPYQGGPGCIDISFDRGICGAAARLDETQLVADVDTFPGHIACADSTRSEVVVPVRAPSGAVIAVLDVDSDEMNAFDDTDKRYLEILAGKLGERWGAEAAGSIGD